MSYVELKSYRVRFAALVWFVSELVLQIHGIDFWEAHGGSLGWVWSIAIGIIAVWSWLHDRAALRWWVGGIASLLLLIGPLLQIGAPVVAQIERRDTQQSTVAERIVILRSAEAQQVETLKNCEDNSKKFRGWEPAIARATATLDTTRAALLDLLANPPTAQASWLSKTVIGVQLVALILLQVTAVAALGVIRIGDIPAVVTVSKPTVAAPLHCATGPVWKVDTTGTLDRRTLADYIAAGQYGSSPSMRKIIATDRVRHSEVQAAFFELIARGKMVRDGQRFRLV